MSPWGDGAAGRPERRVWPEMGESPCGHPGCWEHTEEWKHSAAGREWARNKVEAATGRKTAFSDEVRAVVGAAAAPEQQDERREYECVCGNHVVDAPNYTIGHRVGCPNGFSERMRMERLGCAPSTSTHDERWEDEVSEIAEIITRHYVETADSAFEVAAVEIHRRFCRTSTHDDLVAELGDVLRSVEQGIVPMQRLIDLLRRAAAALSGEAVTLPDHDRG